MAETWKKVAFEDDVVLKALFDAQSVLAATADDTPAALVVAEQEVVGRLTGGNVDGIALGIADNNIVQIDGTANDTEWAIFNAAGLEGLTDAEAMAALSGDAAAAFDWGGQNIINLNSVYLVEQAEADAEEANSGQIWVKAGAPSSLYYTDDAGTDVLIASGGAAAVTAHKDTHDPEDGSDLLDCAAALEISVVIAAAEGTAHSFARSDHVHAINHAITDNHIVTIDGTANANEHAVFSANGIAGLTDAELMAALSGDAAAAFDLGGQQLQNWVHETVADDAAKTALTQQVGMMVWQTDDAALYLCTAAA